MKERRYDNLIEIQKKAVKLLFYRFLFPRQLVY